MMKTISQSIHNFLIFSLFSASIHAASTAISLGESVCGAAGASAASGEPTSAKIIINSSATLTEKGLVAAFSVGNPHELDPKQLAEINTLLEAPVKGSKSSESIPVKPLDLPMTASDAMARHWLQEEYKDGDDVGNIEKLMEILREYKRNPGKSPISGEDHGPEAPLTPDQEGHIKRLFHWALEGERANPDYIALYHGASGLQGFLYEFYKATYNLLIPEDPCKLRARPFDKDFFSFGEEFSPEEFEASDNTSYNRHRLFSSISILHGLKIGKGGNAVQYCVLAKPMDRILEFGGDWVDFPGLIAKLLGPLGITLEDHEVHTLKSIRQKYFDRGILLQLLCPSKLFNQYVRHAGTWADLIPIEELVAEDSAEPTLQFVKDLRSGKASELKKLQETFEKRFPFEIFEGNIYTHPDFLNHPDVKVQMAYSTEFPETEKAAFYEELNAALRDILYKRLGTEVKDVHKVFYAFHRQYKAATERLRAHHYHIVEDASTLPTV